MGTTCFCDNLHQVRSIQKDWKAKTLQKMFFSEASSLTDFYISMVLVRFSTVGHFVLFQQKHDCHGKLLILTFKNRLFWMYKSKSLVTLIFSLLFVVFPFLYHRQHLYLTWLYELHGRCLIRSRKCLHFASTWGYHGFHVGPRCFFILPVMLWVFFRFFCRPVSCVPIVVSASRLSILDWPFDFLKRVFSINVVKSTTEIHQVILIIQKYSPHEKFSSPLDVNDL